MVCTKVFLVFSLILFSVRNSAKQRFPLLFVIVAIPQPNKKLEYLKQLLFYYSTYCPNSYILDTSYLPIMSDSEPLESLNQESSSNTEQLKSSTTPNIPARPQTRPQKQTTTTTTVPTDQDSTTETSLENH